MLPSFADLGVPSDLVAALSRRSITEPFPIQAATVVDAMAGRDVCGKAPTGSGKTLAFGIGAIARLTGKPARPKHPRMLVLTPTRELCAQVATELLSLASGRGLKVESFYGGVGYGPQLKALNRGVDIAVACPGRLGDLVERGSIRLDAIEIVVIDEADRMADMGFLPDVRRLLDLTPESRQTLLFSATLDGDIDVLVRKYQRNPVRHETEADKDDASAAVHFFWKCSSGDRVEISADIAAASGPTIIFCRTKHATDRIARQLETRGLRAAAIHGDRSQKQRERALESFIRGSVDALVATDVAARGIHVDGVNAVVHFDPPADSKDYVHRSGRTARAGATGVVVSLVTPEKQGAVKKLQRELHVTMGLTSPDTKVIHAVLGDPPAKKPRPKYEEASGGGARSDRGGARADRSGGFRSNGFKPGGSKFGGPKTGGRKFAGSKPGASRPEGSANGRGDSDGRFRTEGPARSSKPSAGNHKVGKGPRRDFAEGRGGAPGGPNGPKRSTSGKPASDGGANGRDGAKRSTRHVSPGGSPGPKKGRPSHRAPTGR